MLVNELYRKLKWESMLNTLDIPLTIDGEDIIGIEYITEDSKGDGSYGNIRINLKSK